MISDNHARINEIAKQFNLNLVRTRRAQITREILASDIYKILKALVSTTDFKFHFTVWKVSEVPRIPQDVITSLSLKVNEFKDQMRSLINQC
jgi:uncharacterized membrane protein